MRPISIAVSSHLKPFNSHFIGPHLMVSKVETLGVGEEGRSSQLNINPNRPPIMKK